jgi:predicted nuclease of predicted toxin-antitoxin system
VKLLLDQNLSYRLCRPLSPFFERVDQVRRLGLEGSSDIDIWNFALRGDYAIVTRDVDFLGLLERRGAPPKVVYLPLGHAPARFIETCLLSAVEDIRALGESSDRQLLILTGP